MRKNRPVCRKAIPEERRPVYQEQDLAKPENYRTCLYRHIRSQKRKEEHERKWKSGLPASGAPPFGYRASKVQKGSWEIDPEAAEIVRQIFEKASEGLGTTEIAGFLNEKKLPTPWVYEAQHGKRSLSPSDTIPAERLWDGDKVRMILLRYEYTGALVRGKTKVLLSGTGRRCVQPKERQTIIRQVHPALVSEARYAAAISVIHSQKTRTSRLEQEYPLKSKVFCGTCHRRLQYGVTARKAFFFCRHGRQTGVYSSCCKEEYLTADLELRILQELKPYLSREEVLHLEKNRKALEQYLEAVYVYDPEHIEIRLK